MIRQKTDCARWASGAPVLFGADLLLQLSPFPLQFRELLLLRQQFIVTAIQSSRFLLQGLHPFINVLHLCLAGLVAAEVNT